MVLIRLWSGLECHIGFEGGIGHFLPSECIDLNNRISIEITTASYRTIRGYTVVAALCDEIAFWRSDESANPAEEILAASMLSTNCETIMAPLSLSRVIPISNQGSRGHLRRT